MEFCTLTSSATDSYIHGRTVPKRNVHQTDYINLEPSMWDLDKLAGEISETP